MPDDEQIAKRADLLPEEKQAGSDDPEAQAEAILEESEERTFRPEDGSVDDDPGDVVG